MVQEYSKYRRTIAHQQEQCQLDAIEMAKHHKRPTQLRNLERVKYRRQALAKKQEESLLQNEMLAEEQKQREQRMERMRALVSICCVACFLQSWVGNDNRTLYPSVAGSSER